MRSIKNWLTLGAFSLLVLGIPSIASAQRQYDPNYPNNGGYGYPNGGYGNGQYGNYGNNDMRSTVRDLKNRARELQQHLDRDLDHSRYDGSRREDQLNELAKDFKNAVNRLSESNNNYDRYGRRDDKVDRVLSLGSQLDRSLSRSRLDYHVQELWSGIQYDLQVLGNGYGGYNNNNRYPNGNNNRRNLPSWWPF
jgi:hypothetical protein